MLKKKILRFKIHLFFYSKRIFSVDRRWADHRTLGLSMKVYGYINSFVVDAYSELLMKEQFYATPAFVHKHIMYIDASVSSCFS